MVNRKPLVLNSGVISELVSADSIDVTSNLPAIAPSAIFDFKNGLNLDSRIQLSRNSGVGTRFNKLGVLETVPANVPRFDYVNGVSKGLLIERSATNLLTYSDDLTNAAWFKFGTASVAGGIDSLDGGLNAVRFTAADTYNNRVSRIASTTVTGSTYYTLKCFLRSNGNGNSVVLKINSSGGTFKTAETTVTVTDKWQFYTFNFLTNSDNTGVFAILHGNIATPSFDVFRVGIYETQLSNRVAIKTMASPATRLDELAIIPAANIDFINLSEFSAVVEFTAQAVGTATVISFHDATANNRIFIQSIAGVTTLKVITAGVEQCNLALGTLVTGTDYKIAFRVKANDCAASINGAASLTDTSVTIPTVTTINLGSDYANTNILNSTFAKVTFYASVLTNTNLEALSL